jgi:hypothetical protein
MKKTSMNKKRLARLLTGLFVFGFTLTAQATPIYYLDRASFFSSIGDSITDDYSGYPWPEPSGVLTNIQMSAVLGETRYESISFNNLNIVGNVYTYGDGSNYCAGCNGNFKLWFDNTSVTEGGGVFGMGVDVVFHTSRHSSLGDIIPGDSVVDGVILVEFADGTSSYLTVPADIGFFGPEVFFIGITNEVGIKSITMGVEPLYRRHSWVIDNLTIAKQTSSAVPIPPSVYLLGSGLMGLVGLRRKFKTLLQK